MVEREFLELVTYYHKNWLPERDIVKKAYEERFSHTKNGSILIFIDGCAWKSHLFSIEKCHSEDVSKRPVLCIYKRSDNSWSCQVIPENQKSPFSQRIGLPKSWHGLRDSELDAVTGIEGGVFVHISGFLAIHKTYEGAMEMAKVALKEADMLV